MLNSATPRVVTSDHYHDVIVTASRQNDYYWLGADVPGKSVRLFMDREAMETLHRGILAVLYPPEVE